VDSMATWVTPDRLSQSLNSRTAPVVVPNVRVSDRVLPRPSLRRRHATTVFLWTSRPAHTVNSDSMGCLHSAPGREDIESRSSLLCVLTLAGGDSLGYAAMSGSYLNAGSGHQSEADLVPAGATPGYLGPAPFSWSPGAGNRREYLNKT